MKRKYVWRIEYEPFDRESGFPLYPICFFPFGNIKSHLSNTDENRERVIRNFRRTYKRHNPKYDVRVCSARCLGEVDENGIWILKEEEDC